MALPSWGYSENEEHWETGFNTKEDAVGAAKALGHTKFIVGYCAVTPFSMANAAKWAQSFIDDPRPVELAGYVAARFWDDNMWLDCEDGIMSEAFEDAETQDMFPALKQSLDAAMVRDPTWTKLEADPLLQLEVATTVSNWCRYNRIQSRMLDITQEEKFGYETE